MRRWLVTLAVLLGVTVVRAGEEDEFYRGATLERAGRNSEAVEVYRRIVERSPSDPFADDALFELGRLYEEELGDPVRAAEAYDRLARDYPESRLAVRAERRGRELHALLGSGVEAARAWSVAYFGASARPRSASILAVEALLATYPDFPDAAHATYWLGTLLRDEGRFADALIQFSTVQRRWPRSEWAEYGGRAAGDLYLARGDLDSAEAAYRGVAAWEALERLQLERWRARGLIAAYAMVVAAVLGGVIAVRRAAGSLRPLMHAPTELLYFVPVGALFAAAAATEHVAIAHAVAIICAGGAVASWLSGAALEAARSRGVLRLRRVILHITVTTAALLSVCYIAMMRERLLDQLIETVRFGAER